MSYYAYDHKRSDERISNSWRGARKFQRSRRLVGLLLCILFGFTFWQLSLSYDLTKQIHEAKTHNDERKANPQILRESLHNRQVSDADITGASLAEQPQPQQQAHNGGAIRDESPRNVEQVPIKAEAEMPREPQVEVKHDQEGEDGQYVQVESPKQKPVVAEFEDEESRRVAKPKVDAVGNDVESVPEFKKGPVNVQAELDPDHQQEGTLTSPDQAVKLKVIETESEEHLTLEETAESLPELIHFTFEETVKDELLQGWEDEWISHATFNRQKFGKLAEPKVDFVFLWANGSDPAFQETKRPYEENSVLNDPDGRWISSHGINRYRDWDELRYAVRSVEAHASNFRNQIQIIVNSVKNTAAGKQIPTWLDTSSSETASTVRVYSQEEFFDPEKIPCLPSFNSLTMENQLFNTPSTTDYMFALSDDMLLGQQHSASDIVSPLFGPVMGFKTNAYNTINPPTDADAARFGEKPYLIYTSWLLNRRFGNRKRKGQSHFGHALSRSIMREAISSFPGPELESACKRFRGEPGFQLYSWFVTFHYLIERHREVMLWSLITIKYDADGDGYMSWTERQNLIDALRAGMKNEGKASWRKKNFYHIPQLLERAGLEVPKVNNDFVWTSLDGPASIMGLDCEEFEVNECLAPGFSISMANMLGRNPEFSTATIFDRVARQKPQCGDCLIKLLLNQVKRGLEPVLPDAQSQREHREIVVKALMRYKYTIVEPNALFMMITDADQIDSVLTDRFVKGQKEMPGQLCLNDDVNSVVEEDLQDVRDAMSEFFQGILPDKSAFEW